jgi:hypothetical protein
MKAVTNKEFVRLTWDSMVRGGTGVRHERDLRRMGRIADTMRFRYGLGADCCRKWTSKMLGEPIDRADWDAVMYQIDGLLPTVAEGRR